MKLARIAKARTAQKARQTAADMPDWKREMAPNRVAPLETSAYYVPINPPVYVPAHIRR